MLASHGHWALFTFEGRGNDSTRRSRLDGGALHLFPDDRRLGVGVAESFEASVALFWAEHMDHGGGVRRRLLWEPF